MLSRIRPSVLFPLIFVCFSAPIFYLLLTAVFLRTTEIDFSQREKIGVKFLSQLVDTLQTVYMGKQIPHYDALVEEALKRYAQLPERQAQLVGQSESQLHERNRDTFFRAKLLQTWKDRDRTKDFSVDQLAQNLHSVIRDVGDYSNLILDSDLGFYYMMINSVVSLSKFVTDLSDLQKQFTSMSPSAFNKASLRFSRAIEDRTQEIIENIHRSTGVGTPNYDEDSTLTRGLSRALDEFIYKSKEFGDGCIKRGNRSSCSFTDLIAVSFKVWHIHLAELDVMLERRITALSNNRQLIWIMGILSWMLGLILAVIASFQHQKTAKLVHNSETRKRALIDASLDAIITIDQHKKIVEFNRTAEEVFNYPRSEVRGRHVEEFICCGRSREAFNAALKKLDQAEDFKLRNRKIEVSGLRKNGQKIDLEMCVVSSATNEREFLTAFIRDITESNAQKKLLELRQAQMTSQAKMTSLGEMAGGVSHEINNPLAIIQGKVSQVKNKIKTRQFDSDTLVSELEKVETTVSRITKIIKGLRSFSRNSEKDQMEVVKISKIIEDTTELCDQRFRFSNVSLKVNGLVDLTIECRPVQITQVLMNLISNSFDAVVSLQEKWVEINVLEDQNMAKIIVTDSGNGIAPEISEKIMEPFFTTKDVGKGTGLGLSIAKGIAEEHHGHLKLDASSPNTRFILFLPFRQTQANEVRKTG